MGFEGFWWAFGDEGFEFVGSAIGGGGGGEQELGFSSLFLCCVVLFREEKEGGGRGVKGGEEDLGTKENKWRER